MFFAVRERSLGHSYLSDLNEELINAWTVMRDQGNELEALLEGFLSRDSKEFYYSTRGVRSADPLERAARFMYLNQTAWNGLWRVNRWGEFNVPWGKRPFRGMPSTSIQLQESLNNCRLDAVDFRIALERAKPGDFVYLDPPYLPLSATSKFYLYTEKRFREPDLRDLARICQDLTDRGISWVLSNRDTPLVRELFSHANVIALTTRRSVAAQNKRNVESSDSLEAIIVGG